MKAISIVKKALFGPLAVEFYGDLHGEFYMSRNQIGKALGYANPQKAIDNIHVRHKARLDSLSVTLNLRGTDGKLYDTVLYTAKGVYEICRHSERPEANAFFDFVYTILEALRIGYIRLETEKQTQLWKGIRTLSKDTRKAEVDTIAAFVDYAKAQGSGHAERYFTTLSMLANRTAGIRSRDNATGEQLHTLYLTERLIESELMAGMHAEKPYREIYAQCATQAGQLSTIVKRTVERSVSV